MNAPVRSLEVAGDLDDFEQCAGYFAWCWQAGIMDKPDATDGAQHHAVLWGMIDAFGQDEIQQIMAEAFDAVTPLPPDYAAQILRRWEMDDPRDRWRWTGEPPPPAAIRNGPLIREGVAQATRGKSYCTPESTVKAFWYVVQNETSEYLANWLANHPKNARHLKKLWEAKCRPTK